MKLKIKSYFESLNHEQIGLKKEIKVYSIKTLGTGANNANFLVTANGGKFVFRLNMHPHSRNKSRAEFNSLKLVENLGIAPKVWILDDSRKIFNSDFIILDYIEGKTLDKKNYAINNKFIKEIVKLTVKFHSMSLKGGLLKLPKEEANYRALLESIKNKYISLAKLTSNKQILKMIKESYDNLRKNTTNERYHPVVATHGDIAEQNIVIHNGKMKLIDFEGLEITDPAADIAYILTQFGKREFNEKQRNFFLDEYLKLKKDTTLRERVKIFIPLKNFSNFVWAVAQALKIKNGLLHQYYTKKHTLKNAFVYAQKILDRCIKDGSIDKKYRSLNLENELR